LQQRLILGLQQREQHMAGLGMATRLIQLCCLPLPAFAQVFDLPQTVTAHDWRNVRELNRILFQAQLAGVPAAVATFRAFVANMAADKAFLSTIQQQILHDFEATGVLRETTVFIRLVEVSGDIPKLLLVAPALRQQIALDPDFALTLQNTIHGLLRSPSTTIRSTAIQNLPALVNAGLLPAPDASLALEWLQSERVAKNYAHTAKWVANTIALSASQAHTLAQSLRKRMIEVLRQQSGDTLFLKESYLEAFSALIRRALLDPCQALGVTEKSTSSMPLADEMLDWALTSPLTERHLTLFGRTLSSCAVQDAEQALKLLGEMFTSQTIGQLGQGARRDLARHLRQAVRDIFAHGKRPVWLALMSLIDAIDYRLARAIIEAALEVRSQELAVELEAMRQENTLNGDLRKLIHTWKHHHERSESSTEWEELATTIIFNHSKQQI
jgi:hypothetical protein